MNDKHFERIVPAAETVPVFTTVLCLFKLAVTKRYDPNVPPHYIEDASKELLIKEITKFIQIDKNLSSPGIENHTVTAKLNLPYIRNEAVEDLQRQIKYNILNIQDYQRSNSVKDAYIKMLLRRNWWQRLFRYSEVK